LKLSSYKVAIALAVAIVENAFSSIFLSNIIIILNLTGFRNLSGLNPYFASTIQPKSSLIS